LRAYIAAPTGWELLQGTVGPLAATHGLPILELTPDPASALVEVRLPKPPTRHATGLSDDGLLLPLRVVGLQRRWTAALLQLEGYCVNMYIGGCDMRYRALGVEDSNSSLVPLYAARAPMTHVIIGHPVVAVAAAQDQAVSTRPEDLFIQVTAIGSGGKNVTVGPQSTWSVSVNNPSSATARARFVATMASKGGPPQAWSSLKVFSIPAGGSLSLMTDDDETAELKAGADRSVKLLFIDDAVLTNYSSGFRFTINRPVKAATPAITTDKPWESCKPPRLARLLPLCEPTLNL